MRAQPITKTLPLLVTSCLCACASLLPAARLEVNNPWPDCESAKKSFDQITPFSTGMKVVRQQTCVGYLMEPSKVESTELRTNPLGPLQSMGATLKVLP